MLMMINLGYLSKDDPRAESHLRALEKKLGVGGHLMHRYLHHDGIGQDHGATFTVCGFWYVEALARLGHTEEAEAAFEQAHQLAPGLTINTAMAIGNANRLDDRSYYSKWLQREQENPPPYMPQFATISKLEKNGMDNRDEFIAELEAMLVDRQARGEADYLDPLAAGYAALYDAPALALAFFRRDPEVGLMWGAAMSGMRQQPGFRDLVQTLGLVDYWREFGWGDFCRPVDEERFDCR